MKRLFTDSTKSKPEISKFHDKNGDLTGYSFLCGYVERYEKDGDSENSLTLLKEPNDWHVKGFLNGKHVWESFEKLKDARNFCRKA